MERHVIEINALPTKQFDTVSIKCALDTYACMHLGVEGCYLLFFSAPSVVLLRIPFHCSLPICHMQSMPGLRLSVRVFSTRMRKACVDTQNYLTANDGNNKRQYMYVNTTMHIIWVKQKNQQQKTLTKNNSHSWLYSFQFAITCQLAN